MNKKLFIYLLSLLLLVSMVSASVPTNTSDLAFFDFEEGSGSTLDDVYNSRYDGTLVNSHANQYVLDSPNGTGYVGNFSNSTYYSLANKEDFGGMDSYEISFAVKSSTLSSAEMPLVSIDSADLKIKVRSGRVEIDTALSTTACNIDWYEYSAFLSDDEWTYLTVVYDGSTCELFDNLTSVRSESASGVTNTISNYARIAHDDSQYYTGEMDCLSIKVNNTLNSSERSSLRDYCFTGNVSGGGSPEVATDLFVGSIEYDLPFYTNGSDLTQINSTGTMPINFSIVNLGTNASGSFDYRIYLNEAIISSGTTSVSEESNTTVSFNWTKSYGFHNGYIEIDYNGAVSESNESNNLQTLYIPFMDRPFITTPYCDSPIGSSPSSSSCSWYGTFVSEDFNPSWGASSVDPRAKKGYENALGCAINGWNISTTQCDRAINHLFGWADIPYSEWVVVNVQQAHQVGWVGLTYDALFPLLTEENRTYLAPRLQNISQALAYHSSTRPDQSPALNPTPNPGNGWGFFALAYANSVLTLGSDPSNPMQIMNDGNIQKASIYEYWNARTESYLQGYANNSDASYAEPPLYFFYGGVPTNIHTYVLNKMNISLSQDYSNAHDAMAKEMLFLSLDDNYNGNDLRNDEDQEWRVRSWGDTNSYEDWGSDTPMSFGYITLLALNTDDQDLKDALLALRDRTYSSESRSIFETWTYEDLVAEATPQFTLSPYRYDTQWETICIRNGWTFSTDSLFCIDGGDHYMSGHPVSQTFFKYAYGEPFFDYPQVALNDDTRGEQFHNGISYVSYNDSVGAQYVEGCSTPANNEYIGDNDCSNIGSYPDFRRVPENYTGNISQVYISNDGLFSVWKEITPMKNSDDVVEHWIKINDTEIRRVIVSGNSENRIVDGLTNVYQEFSATTNGYNITYNRDGTPYYVEAAMVMNNNSVSEFYVVDTNHTASSTKTGSATLNITYQRGEMIFNESDIDFIKTYSQYNTTKDYVLYYDGSAVVYDNTYVYFDTDNDGVISGRNLTTDGDVLAVDVNGSETFLVSGATYVNKSGENIYSGSMSSFMGFYNVTINESNNNVSTVIFSSYEYITNDSLSNSTVYYGYGLKGINVTTGFSNVVNGYDENSSTFSLKSGSEGSGGDDDSYYQWTFPEQYITTVYVDSYISTTAVSTQTTSTGLEYYDGSSWNSLVGSNCANSCTATLEINYSMNMSVQGLRVKFHSGDIGSGWNYDYRVYELAYNGINNTNNNQVNLTAGNYTFLVIPEGYYAQETTLEVEKDTDYTVNIYDYYNTVLNLSFFESIGGASTGGNLTVNITHLATGWNTTINTTDSNLLVNIINGSYTFSVSGANYASITENHTVGTVSDSINFSLSGYNSLYIEFRDTETENLISNVTLSYISDTYVGTNSTNNGVLYLEVLEPESYTLTYNASGYDDNFYFVTVTNDSFNNLTLYMSPSASTTSITIEIIDESLSSVENAQVKALRYYIGDNTYREVAAGVTNPTGQTDMGLVTGSNFYKFVVIKDGVTLKTTSPFLITGTTIQIQVFLSEEVLTLYNTLNGITNSMSFNEVTNNFKFEFTDGNSVSREYCVYTYRGGVLEDLLINTTCVTGTTGTVLHTVTNTTGLTYYSEAWTTIDGELFLIGKTSHSFRTVGFGSSGLLIQILLTIVMSLAGFLSVELIFLAAPLSIVIGSLIGLHTIGLAITVPLLIVGIILMFMLRRNG